MRARDIAVDMPTVTYAEPVATAVAVMAAGGAPGLIVLDEAGRPGAVLPGTQVLRMTIGLGYQEDPALARAVDEESANTFWQQEADRPVRDCLPPKAPAPATVRGDATLLEVASAMARAHSPLVAVVGEDGLLIGGISLSALLEHLDLPVG